MTIKKRPIGAVFLCLRFSAILLSLFDRLLSHGNAAAAQVILFIIVTALHRTGSLQHYFQHCLTGF